MKYVYEITSTFILLPPVPPFKGNTATHPTNVSGKCGQLGLSQIGTKTGSVGSDLQFLGTTNGHQDKGIYKYVRFQIIAHMLLCVIIRKTCYN